jgi:carboxymethylenebutenolidase
VSGERTTVETPDGTMPAHVWHPAGGTGPAILLLQEIFGISRYIRSRAQDLADLGYVVLAPEVYWRLGVSRVDEGPDAIDEAFALVQQVDWDTAVADGVRALEALRERPERTGGLGIVGFCYGGGLGFNVAARSSCDALVSYYGSSLPALLELAPQVTAPSLHHFGLADSYIDADAVERVRTVLTQREDVVFETYPGADHAFDNPDFAMFHAEASALAWDRTAAFLATVLPPG